jgi:hypothetical protein
MEISYERFLGRVLRGGTPGVQQRDVEHAQAAAQQSLPQERRLQENPKRTTDLHYLSYSKKKRFDIGCWVRADCCGGLLQPNLFQGNVGSPFFVSLLARSVKVKPSGELDAAVCSIPQWRWSTR